MLSENDGKIPMSDPRIGKHIFINQKMVNEKATWSSFSGSLAKVANEKATVPSERGTRSFGPSKMNFMSK